MSTLLSIINTFPYPLKLRYMGGDGLGAQWISWLNDGLFELEKEDMLPELTYEKGVEVVNDRWIVPPPGLRRVLEVSLAAQTDIKPSIREVQGKIKIVNGMTFDQESDPVTFSSVSLQSTDSVTLNVTGRSANDLENFLIVVTAGTLQTSTQIISGNAASSGGTTNVNFLHELSSAWTPAQVTAGRVVDPKYYMLLRYTGFYTPITALTDEIPVDAKFETNLKSWLLWKAWERVRNVSPDTQYHQGQWERKLASIRNERLRLNRQRNTRGREMAGFRQKTKNKYSFTHVSTDT